LRGVRTLLRARLLLRPLLRAGLRIGPARLPKGLLHRRERPVALEMGTTLLKVFGVRVM
jgi:hypothetical protein